MIKQTPAQPPFRVQLYSGKNLNRGSTACKNYFTETWKIQIPTRGSLLYDVLLDQSERVKL